MALTPLEAAELELLKDRRDKLARLELAAAKDSSRELDPHQQPPGEPWRGWVLRAGRGAGKTYAGSHWLNEQCVDNPGLRCRVIAPTYGDAVASFVDGVDGLLRVSNYTAKFRPSEPGGSCVVYPNGSTVWLLGTNSPRDVDRLRALTNIDCDIFEEAFANPRFQEAYDQASLSRRRGMRKFVVTSTPRPHEIWGKWEDDPRITVTHAITSDNKHNDPEWVAEQEEKYKGTRLYRQEFLGEVLDDVEGALWILKDIERSMVGYSWDQVTAPGYMLKHVIGVDPPSGSGTCGIVLMGADRQGHIYALKDLSMTDVQPNEWARVVCDSAKEWDALVIAEVNQGGRMVAEVLRQADPSVPVTTVNAAKGKATRAEPIALLWEAELQSAHMVEERPGDLAKLIDQLCAWVPDAGMDSPDRLDALVWAATYLRGNVHFRGSISVPGRGRSVPTRTLTNTRITR